MEEKKLTDEVIVKALECLVKDGEYHGAVVRLKDILDLIHRLQSENETLKSNKFASWKIKFFNLKEKFDQELAEHNEFVEKINAEIERLKRYEMSESEFQKYCAYKIIEPQIRGCLDRERELQKQVDELKQELGKAYEIERANIQAEIAEAGTSCHWCKQQAVKDTAEEILQGLIDKAYVNECIDLTVNEVKAWFREDYGVEVE